jgi:hypothetical protein
VLDEDALVDGDSMLHSSLRPLPPAKQARCPLALSGDEVVFNFKLKALAH